FFENSEELANLFCADDEGGEKAQRKFVRAVDEQAPLQRFSDERSAIDGEFDADHEAFAANFLDEGIFAGEFLDATADFSAASGSIGEDFCFFQNFQKFERDGADHRAATERCAMNARADAGSDGFGRENRAKRKASGERFCDSHKIRPRRKLLIGEVAAGAAESTLDFVGDEQGIVLRRERASAIPESFADRVDTAFTLNGFKDYGANVFVEFRF